jgi:hypothetical protein
MKINICVPLFNRGSDITNLVQNINSIKIPNITLNVIIGDYHSTDVDLNQIIKDLEIKVTVIQIDGRFNLAKSLQICSDTVLDPDELIMHIDADTVFDNGSELFTRISNYVIQGQSYYCPIVSTEGRPKKWSSQYNGKVYVPTEDHCGSGLILIYNSDYKNSGGFNNSEYMNERGEIWGHHERILLSRLSFLNKIRHIESDIWLRMHKRDKDSVWYSGGSTDYF